MPPRDERDIAARNAGRYVLFREIACGGMATVHLARMRGLAGFARTVAIKRLHPPYARDPEFVSMLLDEARLAARIQHPNVVSVLDVVASNGELCLVMEYVHGEAFSRLLKNAILLDRPVPIPIVVGILVQTLHGLHAAHEARSERGDPLDIVHRDVSPQNVLVGVDGVARVLDFGIAKATQRIHSDTRDGQLKGKLRYMAPEQVALRCVDRRADIYATCAMLWEALTREPLFAERDTIKLMAEILTRKHEPPSKRRPDVPPAIDAIVMRGLSREPDDRYATARDLATELERAVPPASQLEIGEWVALLADMPLRARAMSIAEMETQMDWGRSAAASIPGIPSVPDDGDGESVAPPPPTDERDAEAARAAPTVGPPKAAPPRAVESVLPIPMRGLARIGAQRWLLAACGFAAVASSVALAAQGDANAAASFAPRSRAPLADSFVAAARGATSGAAATKERSVAPPRPASVASASAPIRPQAPASAAEAKARAPRPPAPSAAPPPSSSARGCSPPYTIDENGIRIPKRWCS